MSAHDWRVGQVVSIPSRGWSNRYRFAIVSRVTRTFVETGEGNRTQKWTLRGHTWGHADSYSHDRIIRFDAEHLETNRRWVSEVRALRLARKIEAKIPHRPELDQMLAIAAILDIEEDPPELGWAIDAPQEAPAPDGSP